MKIIDAPQGSPEWHAARLRHHTASEAPAMMGASRYLTRNELLRIKASGIAPEVDARMQALFDRGHAAEAAARAIVERMIGQELYPVTASDDAGWLLASFDGITLDDTTGFEHKLWNEALAAQVRRGQIDPHYAWQLEQQILVAGLEQIIFVCSDGTHERFAMMEYRAQPGWADQLVAGWRQFEKDLAAYVPTVRSPVVVAAPTQSLPAVSVQMQGQLVVASNLPLFADALRAFIERIPLAPETDQQFADCEAGCKGLKNAEEALIAAEDQALAQLSDVEAMRRTIRDLHELARSTRLLREKVVAARKEQIRADIVQRGRERLAAHKAALNDRLGGPLMPVIPSDFAAAIKGKRTIESLQGAVDDELARCKIAADAIARTIQANQATLSALAGEHRFLFDQFDQATHLLLCQPADFTTLVKARITERKAEQAARAQPAMQADAIGSGPPERANCDGDHAEPACADPECWIDGTPQGASERQINLGTINLRLAPIHVTASGLSTFGIAPVATTKTAKLYRERDLPRICDALIAHLQQVRHVPIPTPEEATA